MSVVKFASRFDDAPQSSTTLSLFDLLTDVGVEGSFWVLPDYQREFSWSAENACAWLNLQVLSDVRLVLAGEEFRSDRYAGEVSITSASRGSAVAIAGVPSRSSRREVADGQQRLTAVSLFCLSLVDVVGVSSLSDEAVLALGGCYLLSLVRRSCVL